MPAETYLYVVVKAKGLTNLHNGCHNLIKQGYTPTGGIIIQGKEFWQSMYKLPEKVV